MPKMSFDMDQPHTLGRATDVLVEHSLSGATMGTRWAARYQPVPGLDGVLLERDLQQAVDQVDNQMSTWKPDSDLMRLNRAAPGQWVDLPPEIMCVLACALDVGRQSDGAFDIAVGGLVEAWGFGASRTQPDAEAIRRATLGFRAAHVSLELDVAAGRARKTHPLTLDLCGIAKGYGVDKMTAVMRQHGVARALLSLDGELCALSGHADGRPWAVALERPQAGIRAAHGVIQLENIAVATSGDYRHRIHFEPGQWVSHTMDGRARRPADHAVASITVLAPNCMRADAWASALLVLGAHEGPAMAQRIGLDALFLMRRPLGWLEWGTGCFGSPAGLA